MTTEHMGQPIGDGAGRGHFKDGSNIGSFDGNATLDGADDEFPDAYLPAGIKLVISGIWLESELAEQQQDQQHYQNQSAKAHAGMAHAVAIAAETAAEASQQEDDQDNDEDQAERHVRSLR